MKTMRKFASLCAGCLMLTAFPLPAAAADDDPVLTQIAGLKNDRFTVEAKKIGYTALNGECPERPEWFTLPDYYDESYYEQIGREPFTSDDEWFAYQWEAQTTEPDYFKEYIEDWETGMKLPSYRVSNSAGRALIVDRKALHPDTFCKIIMMNRDGSDSYETVVSGACNDRNLFFYDKNIISMQGNQLYFSDGIITDWRSYYPNTKSGNVFSYDLGTMMYNGIACVLDIMDDHKKLKDLYEWEIKEDSEWPTLKDIAFPCTLSLINDKGDKILTLSEPVQLKGGYQGAWWIEYYGYNYQMNLGGYSENLVWFECDRQMGATLNDLIENTGSDKDGETDGKSNQYQFAEHTCGYADLQGNVVIPQKYDEVYPFSGGIAGVGMNVLDENEFRRMKYGFIDKTGNYIVEPQYDGIGLFSEGLAAVALTKQDENNVSSNCCGYIDKTGKVTIELQYEDAGDFQNGVARVKKDGKWGYINTTGETVVPFEYAETYGSDGTCFVVGKEIDGAIKFGAIDAEGNTILPFIFEDMSNPVNGLVYAFCNKELYSMEIAEILESGDLSGDGDISIDDAQLALIAYTEKLSGKDSGLTPGQLKAADVNGDGELTVEDAQVILIYYTENKVAGKHLTWEDVLNR